MQRFQQIVLALDRDPRNRLVPGITIRMARGAAPSGGGLLAFFGEIRIVVLRTFRRRQRCEVSPEIADILVVDLFDDRLHLLVLAAAGTEVDELPLDELILV